MSSNKGGPIPSTQDMPLTSQYPLTTHYSLKVNQLDGLTIFYSPARTTLGIKLSWNIKQTDNNWSNSFGYTVLQTIIALALADNFLDRSELYIKQGL